MAEIGNGLQLAVGKELAVKGIRIDCCIVDFVKVIYATRTVRQLLKLIATRSLMRSSTAIPGTGCFDVFKMHSVVCFVRMKPLEKALSNFTLDRWRPVALAY